MWFLEQKRHRYCEPKYLGPIRTIPHQRLYSGAMDLERLIEKPDGTGLVADLGSGGLAGLMSMIKEESTLRSLPIAYLRRVLAEADGEHEGSSVAPICSLS